MDEVDRIIAAWEVETPGLDTEPLAVLSRVSRLARHLDLARKRCFAAHGLEIWEFDVLASLRREGAPYELSPGELIHQTLSTSATMTNRIDRLAGRGLVERQVNPDDRRSVRVRLTPSGSALVGAALVDLIDYERGVLEPLNPFTRRQLTGSLRTLLASFEASGDD
ncbi:MarR family winged helix-turn-helix transcriptional regulator [Micropruina sonneratiae]|uniref:MarR family winged helix-turn-helix transcriptional regulator n=1 Tax=Micropruina sonneratiae TaxID=2986940 RepID=UPI0029D41C60|nr:MarR family transcriptional regulator [Micropruina sp. KQZ13P-5]